MKIQRKWKTKEDKKTKKRKDKRKNVVNFLNHVIERERKQCKKYKKCKEKKNCKNDKNKLLVSETLKQKLNEHIFELKNKKKQKMIELKSKNKLKSQFEGEKILFIERTCGDKKFSGLSPFYVKKVVDNVAGGTIVTARQTRDGRILVHTENRKQAENFMKLSKIDQFNVAVSEDEKAAQSTGVIYCRDLKYSTDEEILDELKDQKIKKKKRRKWRTI